MSNDFEDQVRVNKFDQWVGKYQTELVMEKGVGTSILDIGCGIGQFTPLFLERFDRVVGLDPSQEYLNQARKVNNDVEYVLGYGETFLLNERFDTITMNMLLEHVDDPVLLLKNCKKHLNKEGMIMAQVPNSRSVTRRLGLLMGIIDSLDNITDKEKDFYGHKRVYTLDTLETDFKSAGLTVIESGGLMFKPLPNQMLLEICLKKGKEWTDKFMQSLVEFGKDRPEDCANLYICASQ